MTIKRLFLCLAAALGVVGVFNAFLAVRIHPVQQQIMKRMRATPKIDILFLGNSLMQSGLSTESFASAWPDSNATPIAFNAGLGGTYPVEHYLLAHQAYLHHEPIPCLVYGYFNCELTQPPPFAWADLIGNRAMGYSTEPAMAASLYAPESMLECWRFQLIGAVPMLREHSQLWKYVEIFRRFLQEAGMPKAKMNQFGRVTDFRAVALPDLLKFKQDCEKSVQNSSPLIPPVQALLRLAHNQNTRVFVVEMPVSSAHRDSYYSTPAWQHYREYLVQRLQAEGATYVVASDWVPDDADFSDLLHLNQTGSDLFSKKIAHVIAAATLPDQKPRAKTGR
jgi:hypothetical protein